MAQLTFCKLQKLVLENMLNAGSHLDSPELIFLAVYYVFIHNLEAIKNKKRCSCILQNTYRGSSFLSKVQVRDIPSRLSEYIPE